MIGDAAVLGISQNPYDVNRNLIAYAITPSQSEMNGISISANLTNIAIGANAYGMKIKAPTTSGSAGHGTWAGIYIEDTGPAIPALSASYGIYQAGGSSRFSDLTVAGTITSIKTGSGLAQSVSNSGGSNMWTLENTSNTANSSATLNLYVAGTSAGNANLRFNTGTPNWFFGALANGTFEFDRQTSPGGSQVFTVDASRNISFYGAITASNLTASKLVATDGSKAFTTTVSGLSPGFTGLSLSGLTASQAVFTDASKNLVSNAVTGTGSVVMSSVLGSYPTGSGTPNVIPLWTGTSALGTSALSQSGVALTASSDLSVNGSLILGGGGISHSISSSGSTLTWTLQNLSNTANSAVTLNLYVAGTSAGNAKILFNTGAPTWFFGALANGTFEFNRQSTPGGSQVFTADASQNITFYGAITAPNLTASKLVATDGSKAFTTTVSGLSPGFTGLSLSGLTASQAVFTDASKNLVSNAITGTGSVVMSTSPTMVTPVLGAATATSISFGDTTLSKYKESSFTGTMTGLTTSPSGTIYYTITGKQVTLIIPQILGTSNSVACTITGMPSEIYPARLLYANLLGVIDNGTVYAGGCSISTSGVITLLYNITNSFFTSSGTKGISLGSTISYTLQ